MESALRELGVGERARLTLIETLRRDAGGVFVRRDAHLLRMEASARALGFPYRRAGALAALASTGAAGEARVRLTLDVGGRFAATAAPLAAPPAFWTLALSPVRLDAADPWLRHKTSRRALFDATRARLPPGVDEVLFCNRDGALCEGTITTLFVRRGGVLLTPPLACGLLPGVLRAELLGTGGAREAMLIPADLAGAEAILVGNSLRGLIPARLAPGLDVASPQA